MGLDISLYPIADHEQSERHSAEWDALYDRKERGEITEAEYEDLRARITPYTPHEDKPSERYPEHLMNRRYLRSSYNGSGFNNAVRDFLGDGHGDFYWMFEPMGREWDWAEDDPDPGLLGSDDIPKFQQVKERALSVADELRKCDSLRTDAISAPPVGAAEHMWHRRPSEEEVLAWYREETRRSTSFTSYSCAKGHVFGEGLTVLGITLGRDILGQPAAIIVYRSEAIDSYIESAEIVVEFCDEAVGLIEQDGSAYISWSG